MRDEHAEGSLGQIIEIIGADEFDLERLGAGGENGERLWVGVSIDDEDGAGGRVRPHGEGHSLCGRRGFIEHRGVRDLHADEVGDHRLEREQHLETTLGDLRLIGGVCRVPRRVLEHVASQDRGSGGAVVAPPDHRWSGVVRRGEASECGQDLDLVARSGEFERSVLTDRRRHDRIEERVE